MVEAQARHWALKQSGPRDVVQEAWPVVTISREVGDQDLALGRNVAGRLGFSYRDHDLVMELVGQLNTDSATSISFDRRMREAIEEFLGTGTPAREVALTDYDEQIRLIVDLIARRGGVVIDGRGAQFLVDPRNALRVRLVAPLELRARRVELRDHISFAAARQSVLSGDRARAAFVLGGLGHDVTDPAHFDIVVNTETYPGERAVALVLMAYFAKFGDRPLAVHALKGKRRPVPALVLPAIRALAPTTSRSS